MRPLSHLSTTYELFAQNCIVLHITTWVKGAHHDDERTDRHKYDI